MAVAQTLKEIALEKAKKRPELVDYLTEEAPILTLLKWIPATHGLWNVEEVLDAITGASFMTWRMERSTYRRCRTKHISTISQ